jgi:hypothetical protein
MESKMSLPNENSELARVLPLQVDSRLYKQPLWLMQ